MEWKKASLGPWFLILLSLNFLDILLTNPVREANPLTLLLWSNVGIIPSACIKIGLVLLFGALCAILKRFASQNDWYTASKLFRGILICLVAFYSFVVVWNMIIML